MPLSTSKNSKKKASNAYEVTSSNGFTPKTSDRTKQEVESNVSQPKRVISGLDKCCIVFLYILLVLCILIGVGGIVVCIIYFNTSSNTQGWKIGGIVLGAVTCVVGLILIVVAIYKQTHKKSWRYRKQKNFYYDNDYRKNTGNDNRLNSRKYENDNNQINIKSRDGNDAQSKVINLVNDSQSVMIQPLSNEKISQTVLTPRLDSIIEPSQLKTERKENEFPKQIQPSQKTSNQDLMLFTADDNERTKRNRGAFTTMNRSMHQSNSFNTHKNITLNSTPNITETLVVRRIPIPTPKVAVQQPTTKVLIVKVPNVAGELVIQPKTKRIDE